MSVSQGHAWSFLPLNYDLILFRVFKILNYVLHACALIMFHDLVLKMSTSLSKFLVDLIIIICTSKQVADSRLGLNFKAEDSKIMNGE